MYDYVVIGGGCYGSYYVGQLTEARQRGKLDWERIAVLDRMADCRVAAEPWDDVDVVTCDWTEFGARALRSPEEWLSGQIVPAPIAPHVLRHWLTDHLASQRALRACVETWTAELPDLPYADVTASGSLVLSWAPGLCPTNCIEPRNCPLTQGPRSWDMPDTVDEVTSSLGLAAVVKFVCRHYAYGVGTIAGGAVRRAAETLRSIDPGAMVAIATTSGCHGLVDLVRFEAMEAV